MIVNNPDILKAHPFSGDVGVKTDVFTYSSSGILRTCYPAGNTSLRLHFIINYFLPILSALSYSVHLSQLEFYTRYVIILKSLLHLNDYLKL